jgi:hypothetical protein
MWRGALARCPGTGACTARRGSSSSGGCVSSLQGPWQVRCGMQALDAGTGSLCHAACTHSTRALRQAEPHHMVPTWVLLSWHASSALVSMGAIW